MQHTLPKFTLLPNTGLATALSDSSKTHQVVLKVPDTVDLSISLMFPAAWWGEGGGGTTQNNPKPQNDSIGFCFHLTQWKKEHIGTHCLLVRVTPLTSKGEDYLHSLSSLMHPGFQEHLLRFLAHHSLCPQFPFLCLQLISDHLSMAKIPEQGLMLKGKGLSCTSLR